MTVATFLAVSLLVAAPASASRSQAPPVNPDAKAQAEFAARLDQYVRLHAKVEATIPRRSDQAEPEAIETYRITLGRRIAEARATAKPGDIFTPPVRNVFRRLIRSALRGPEGQHIVDQILDENTRLVPLRINGPYPDEAPLSTVPARLLRALPRLPEDIEYRFVGRRLILFDRDAHIIVDYMTNALP